VTALSAVTSALAVGLAFIVANQLLMESELRADAVVTIASWAAIGTFGFGELLWSQATIAEVYGLNICILAALLALGLLLAPSIRPYGLALLFGFGLAHHATIVLLLPALWPYLPALLRWLSRRRFLNIMLCLIPGLLIYLYIPIRAAAAPIPNWGQADNLRSLVWLVSGALYRPYMRTHTVLPFLWEQLPELVGVWIRDFGWLGLGLAAVGLARGLATLRRFSLFSLSYVALLSVYTALYRTSDSHLYLIPTSLVIALWMSCGAAAALRALRSVLGAGSWQRMVLVAAAALLAFVPLASLCAHYRDMDIHDDREAYTFAEGILEAAAPDAILVSRGDQQTFPLWYLRYGLGERPDTIVVDRLLLVFGWYRQDLEEHHHELARVTSASNANQALAALVQEGGLYRPVQLTFSDEYAFSLARWIDQDPLFTLVRE
jgi:hypothetical protein